MPLRPWSVCARSSHSICEEGVSSVAFVKNIVSSTILISIRRLRLLLLLQLLKAILYHMRCFYFPKKVTHTADQNTILIAGQSFLFQMADFNKNKKCANANASSTGWGIIHLYGKIRMGGSRSDKSGQRFY